ncbi:hypothetical protein KNP414_06484 [Paenibacillus mucilaginosus KNP414]|uniref:Uncharacterized protein n=1 Tax=Paenibacillus mucilaginosus (strain KNP414) TaxID=1036673 RepID=F8FNT6_PAEMK|nr:hypothetical protein KNP414_06484 [Paenibacillus mucilaginosus KNP414]
MKPPVFRSSASRPEESTGMKPPVLCSSASRPEERTGYEAAGFPLFGFAP